MRKTKVCTSCYREWQASSNHRLCDRCRKQLPHYKDGCPTCGKPKCRQSKHCRKCAQKWELNGNWKGGKIYHKKGYVFEWTENRGYVAQHRLVMERFIGRELTQNETVHHINGVKDNNGLENLELWVSTHPNGQRVRDLVVWARLILSKYGTVFPE